MGVIDRQAEVAGQLNGSFACEDSVTISGRFSAKPTEGTIAFADGSGREICRLPLIRLVSGQGSSFLLRNVTAGKGFHWERKEDQTFAGDLLLRLRQDGTIAAVNEIPIEDYLAIVISSEMNAAAPKEFLKAHAILSRSWLLAALGRKEKTDQPSIKIERQAEDGREFVRWYEREAHDLFDVCADDHCQRYQGMTKAASGQAAEAVRETRGMAITCRGEICDARYSKACGGITEEFETAWAATPVPYLQSISDASARHPPIASEEDASRWILSEPEAYCNVGDGGLLETILPRFDRTTKDFFRWKVEYSRTELEEILLEKSGIDFGTLEEIVPLQRGPSGRIARLKIAGSKRTVVVGKELEIRKWLSGSHLYSSAFVVTVSRDPRGEAERFVFHGAGWGHGVGLCQIGAAVMAARGFTTGQILKHYFKGVEIEKIY